jgi:hypothetical protein
VPARSARKVVVTVADQSDPTLDGARSSNLLSVWRNSVPEMSSRMTASITSAAESEENHRERHLTVTGRRYPYLVR